MDVVTAASAPGYRNTMFGLHDFSHPPNTFPLGLARHYCALKRLGITLGGSIVPSRLRRSLAPPHSYFLSSLEAAVCMERAATLEAAAQASPADQVTTPR